MLFCSSVHLAVEFAIPFLVDRRGFFFHFDAASMFAFHPNAFYRAVVVVQLVRLFFFILPKILLKFYTFFCVPPTNN